MTENVQAPYADVDESIARHGGNRSALIQILLDIQKRKHWLPEEDLLHISQRLSVPLPHIYQIATFYKAFSLKRRGRHLVQVCMGTACHVRGAPPLLDRVSRKLGLRPGRTSRDDRFTLLTVNCMGCCALGPVLAVDGTYYSNVSQAEFEKILDQYK